VAGDGSILGVDPVGDQIDPVFFETFVSFCFKAIPFF
jgi:hypothetical protein